MAYHQPRKSLVPWLWDSDLDEGQRALWDLEYQHDVDRASCWSVQNFEKAGVTTDFLIVHAVRGNGNDGGRITLALSGTPRFDVYAKECFALAAQSNPQRHPYRSDASFAEDGA